MPKKDKHWFVNQCKKKFVEGGATKLITRIHTKKVHTKYYLGDLRRVLE
jgi:hypothetical protein